MSCSITRSPEGTITKVLDKNKKESKLFKSIASHTLVADVETALEIYKNIYSNSLKDVDESAMELSHKVGDAQYDSFKNALKEAKESTEISVGVLADEKFVELLSIQKNTDLTNELGFVQAGILNGNIAEERIKVGNQYLLQAKGKREVRKQASLSILREQSAVNLGSQSFVVDGTAFSLKKTLGSSTLYNKIGEKVEIENSELAKLSDDEIMSKFDNGIALIAEREFSKNFPQRRDSKLLTNASIIKEDSELVKNLVGLLKNMGVSIVSMTNYITNYTLRHGVNPNAEAFADIANQVIGVVAGKETTKNLLEETVHFIVEALPQERIENVLRNIDKSEEYKQHYQIQKAIYESEYSGEELENVVRREILGKIITNSITQTEKKSETQQNFFENAKKFISEFFQDIINYFKAEYQVELDNLLEDVRNLIDSQDVSRLELGNFEGNQRRFYNASGASDFKSSSDPIIRESLKTITILTKLEKDLNKTGKGNNLNLKELRNAQSRLEQVYDEHAIAKVTQIAENTTKILEVALKDSKLNNKTFDLSQEENVVYSNLTTEVKRGLSVLKEMLDNKVGITQVEKNLADNISQTVSRINELEAKRTIDHNTIVEKMARAATTDRGLSEKELQSMISWISRCESDINNFNKTFGTLNNSQDSLANLYATLKTNMTNRASQKSHNETKKLQAELKKYGYDEKHVASLVKDGYFESERDIVSYLKARDENFKVAYDAEFKDSKLTTDELLLARKQDKLTWTPEQQDRIEKAEKRANDAISERRMTDEYYADLEAKYIRLSISEETQDLLGQLNSQKSRIRQKSIDKNGIEDLSKLSLQDLELLRQLDSHRRQMKSSVEFDGTLKTGLKFTKNNEGRTQISLDKVALEDLPQDSRLAYDIFILDNDGTIEKRSVERPKSFDKLILSKATKAEQVTALTLNSNIGFSSEFWDNLKGNQSVIDRLKELESTDQIKILVAELQDISDKEKALIKAHIKATNPSETDVERMSPLTKTALKDLAERNEKAREKAKKLTKDAAVKINDFEDAVSGSNQAWQDLLDDNDLSVSPSLEAIKNILNLAKRHSTLKNSQAISDAETNTRLFREGKTTHLSKSVQYALEKQGLTKNDLEDDLKYADFLKTYAEERLLSYYKRFTPIGYNEFQEDLESDMPMDEILKKNYKYLQITPSYSFNDEDVSNMNPNYIKNSKMGYTQPKKSMFENKDFTNKFGKIARDDKGYIVSAEKDSNEFQAYKAIMNFRFNQIDVMDGGTSYNAYITPQIRKQGIERWKDFTLQGTKDTFENWIKFTEDDMERGDITFGVNNKIIPRQYLNTLENQTDITKDVFNALILTNNAANLYESRVNYYGDFMAIHDVAKNRQNGLGKDTSATNRFKTLDSATDNDLFGIKQIETDTILGQNTAKVVGSLGAFVRLKGLGGSIIIPLTAYLTAKTKQTVEILVGQYYNKDSFNRGAKEYNKQLQKALAETGDLQSVAELNTKGEYWQAFELGNRIYGSSFNKLQRFLSKSMMILYQTVNYPIYGKNMYNVLHDFRIVDGKVVKFTDFQRNEQNKNYTRSKEDIKAAWTKENNVINNFHSSNENGEIIWDKLGLKKLLTDNNKQEYSDEALDQEILRFVDDIRIQIKNLNVNIDMQLSHEDKVLAQRHYLLNFLMAFKGYMIPLYESRFKNPKNKFNSQSRQLEEGSYVGIYNLGKDILKEWKQNGVGFMTAFKNQYDGDFTEQIAKIESLKNLTTKTVQQEQELKALTEDLVRDMEMVDLRHAHLKRLGVDLLVLNSLVVIMMLLRSYADDDKDKSNYPIQLAALLSQRLTGEVNSANFNITSNYYETASNPLQAFRIITDVAKFPKAIEDKKFIYTVAKGYFPLVNSLEQMLDPSTSRDNARYYSEVKGNAYWSSPIYHLMNKD
jgi:hypothetical protein